MKKRKNQKDEKGKNPVDITIGIILYNIYHIKLYIYIYIYIYIYK